MKHIRLLILAAVCGSLFSFIASASAQAMQGVASVVRIRGSATYSTDGQSWQPLFVGATLGAGAVIKTDADSSVDIVLSDRPVNTSMQSGPAAGLPAMDNSGAPLRTASVNNAAVQQNVIRLAGGTTLAIDKLTFTNTGADNVSDTELNLQSGHVFGNVKKLSAMSKYEVKTPVGVAGIRGTSFWIGSDGSAACGNGSVVISFSNGPLAGQTVVLNGGLEINSETGQIIAISGNISQELANELSQSTIVNIVYSPDKTTVYVSDTSPK